MPISRSRAAPGLESFATSVTATRKAIGMTPRERARLLGRRLTDTTFLHKLNRIERRVEDDTDTDDKEGGWGGKRGEGRKEGSKEDVSILNHGLRYRIDTCMRRTDGGRSECLMRLHALTFSGSFSSCSEGLGIGHPSHEEQLDAPHPTLLRLK